MLDWNGDAVHVNWTEDRLLQEIADLEMSLAEQDILGDSDRDWRRFLLIKSLENRRRMLAALTGQRRTRALPVRVRHSS